MAFWRSARHNWRRFSELSPSTRGLVLRAAILLPLVRGGRLLMSFKRLHSTLSRAFPLRDRMSHIPESTDAPRIAQAVSIAARHGLVRANCLERSLVLWSLMRRSGLPGTLRFGARRLDGDFEAHAWVEYRGVVLNDAQDVAERFVVFSEPVGT